MDSFLAITFKTPHTAKKFSMNLNSNGNFGFA